MNATKDYEFTIIVPVYNEEENMARLTDVLGTYIGHAPVRTCVLFVNDGSKDGSLSLIEETCQSHDSFFYVSSAENHGLSTAMKMGFDTAESRYVGYIDGDLQTSPEDFDLLLAYAPEFELVSGIRAKRKDSWFKRKQSRIANGFRRMMTGDSATDTGCPLKVMHTSFVKTLPFFDGMHRFLPALTILAGGSFKEIPVRHFPRVAGVSKYHLWNRLKGPFVDCFVFRWMRKRYIRYEVTSAWVNNNG